MAVTSPPALPIRGARLYPVLTERLKLVLVLLAALLQGLLYLVLLPPWQHYDEPSHFEYAWLIVEHGRLPQANDIENPLRREIITSMIAHDFYWNIPQPNLMTDRPISLGYSQLEDPPLYYLLVSLPLRLVHHLDLASQLYVARLVSLGLFILTIAIAAGIAHDLTTPGSLLRWTVPLTVALLPPVADVMTAVNNDVGAVFVFSLFLWGAVRTIRFGITPLRLLWLLICVGLGLFTKNTAAITVALLPLVLVVRLWDRFEVRWLWLLPAGLAAFIALMFGLFEWHDAAYWYRMYDTTLQAEPTRAEAGLIRGQPRALMLVARPGERSQLLSSLLDQDTRRAAGHTVTIGGWVWADQPSVATRLGLNVSARGAITFERISQPVTVTTQPAFVAWTYDVPPGTGTIQLTLEERATDVPIRVQLRQPFVIIGTFAAGTEPVFDDQTATSGSWAGQRFTNLLRNASAEQTWPHLRPELHRLLSRVMPRPPAQMLPALFDRQLSWPFMFGTVLPSHVYGLFTGLAWGHVGLDGLPWSLIFQVLSLIAVLGTARWWASHASHQTAVRPALVLLAIAALLVWTNAIIWPMPMVTWARPPVTAARYIFPSIVPVALILAGGWWSLWPRAYRRFGAYAFVCSLLFVNISSLWRLWSFYQSVAAGTAGG